MCWKQYACTPLRCARPGLPVATSDVGYPHHVVTDMCGKEIDRIPLRDFLRPTLLCWWAKVAAAYSKLCIVRSMPRCLDALLRQALGGDQPTASAGRRRG